MCVISGSLLVNTGTHCHTGNKAATEIYMKSLMCKQLLLFARTTCSFWKETKHIMGCVTSVACVGGCLATEDAYPHGRVGLRWWDSAGRQPSLNRTPTDLTEWSYSNILTCFPSLQCTHLQLCQKTKTTSTVNKVV